VWRKEIEMIIWIVVNGLVLYLSDYENPSKIIRFSNNKKEAYVFISKKQIDYVTKTLGVPNYFSAYA